jgi:hypothetical protein
LLQSREDWWRRELAQLRLDIAEADERQMAEWRHLHPKDVAREEAFWTQKKAERRREGRIGGG